MKLFGGRRKSKHRMQSAGRDKDRNINQDGREYTNKEKARRRLKVLIALLSVVLTLLIALYVALTFYVKPPEVSGTKNPGAEPTGTETDSSQTPDVSGEDSRTGGKYTFVVLGTDDGNGNTDTIMVVSFDTKSYNFNVVSIPRDTLVNVSWSVKKANTLYSAGGTDGVIDGLADLLGFKVDFYVVVDLEAFQVLVDAIGGVTYDVPVNMNYEDPAQDLYIHLTKGTQKLTGEQAIGVMRFRSGYANADIGRIGTQQDFLKTVADQVLANRNSLNISSLAKIFLNYVKTDLDYGEIIWLAKEFYKVDGDNIKFMTLPGNYGDACYHGGQWVSYVTIYVNEWLDMINQYLNPFDDNIELKNLDILTRDTSTGKLYATSGVFAGKSSWGYKSGSSGSSSGSSSSGSSSSGSSSSGSSSSGSSSSGSSGSGTTGTNTGTSGGAESGTTGTDTGTGTTTETGTDTGTGTDTEAGTGTGTDGGGSGDTGSEGTDTNMTPNDGSGIGIA